MYTVWWEIFQYLCNKKTYSIAASHGFMWRPVYQLFVQSFKFFEIKKKPFKKWWIHEWMHSKKNHQVIEKKKIYKRLCFKCLYRKFTHSYTTHKQKTICMEVLQFAAELISLLNTHFFCIFFLTIVFYRDAFLYFF